MAMTYDPTTADPGQIEKIAPADLVIDPNVRTNVHLDKSFVSSIRVFGFQQYPVGYRDDEGRVHITVGQRRTSAALEIGWPVVPIVIKPKADAEHDRTEELRILAQLAENEQREGLTNSDRVAAYRQLSLFGVSEDQIARKTNAPKQTIKTALTLATSTAALAAADQHELTLDQAAIIAEFEGDERAIAQLNETASSNPAQLAHTAEQIRNRRLDEEAIERLREKAMDAGAKVVETFGDVQARSLEDLWRVDDTTRSKITLAQIRKGDYTGFVATIRRGYGASQNGANRGYEIVFGLSGWKNQGLTTYGDRAPLTEQEKEERRQKRIDKAEMIAATEVRRTWLRDELLNPAHKHYPDSAMAWVARDLWLGDGALRHSYNPGIHFTLETLLATDPDKPTRPHNRRNLDTGEHLYASKAVVEQLLTDTRNPFRIALAIAIGHSEQVVGDPKTDGFGQTPRHAAYLRQLAEWGYTLSDVELRIIATADANHAQFAGETDA